MNTILEGLLNLKNNKPIIIVDDGTEGNEGYIMLSAIKSSSDFLDLAVDMTGGQLAVVIAADDETDPALLDLPRQKLMNVHIYHAALGGVLKKADFNEAAIDMLTMANFQQVALVGKLRHRDGAALRFEEIERLATEQNLAVISIELLIAHRRAHESYVVREAEANLPTEYGDFLMVGFVNKLNGEHHVALVKGNFTEDEPVLVRVHSECLTGDAFHSLKCDCGEQLAAALATINEAGKGVLVYLRQEGRGIGLINKIKAYKLQEQGMDTEEANLALGFPSDLRDYGIGAQILSMVGAKKIRLLTNNPKKVIGLKGHGIEIVERVPLIMDANVHNKKYFQTKKDKMGHFY